MNLIFTKMDQQPTNNMPVQDNCGFWSYKELPEGAVQVTAEMYHSGVLSRKNTPYVIKSVVYEEYQCFRVNDTTHTRIIPFVESNSVYLIPTSDRITKPQGDIPLANKVFELEI